MVSCRDGRRSPPIQTPTKKVKLRSLIRNLYGMERDGDKIPEPTPVTELHPQANQAIVLTEAWMPFYRNVIENHAVKKTLTIPKWLNDLAEEKQVNFSQLLQTALKKHLGVTDYKLKAKRQA